MISTDLKRVQVQDIVENQLPAFAREDFPLIVEFLKQYYISQEYPGASVDLIQNIDQYLKLETLTNNTSSTLLASDISFSDTTIEVGFDISSNIFGTYQFPEKYGLIQIDDEIILYTGKTRNSFTGCVRGFSGVKSYRNLDSSDKLTFSESEIAEHTQGAEIVNLSALLFEEFLTKIKYQFSPGFQNREIDSDVNQRLFISKSKDFYKTKGTDDSFRILFGALYGEDVEVIKPKDFLFRPSDAQYRVTKDLVVEAISGDPSTLKNQTLFQDAYDSYDIQKSYASITDVEKLIYGDKSFYKLSVDFDYSKDITFDGSILGNFSVHPKTRIVNQVSAGSSVIDVDSTVGFPETGELVVTYSTGTSGTLSYTSKSINQFFGVGLANTTTVGTASETTINSESDIRLNAYAYAYVGVGTANRVDMRVGSVLSEPVIDADTYYFSKNDTAKIKSLGITTSSPKTDSWIYNIPNKFDVENVTISDSSVPSYVVRTYSKNNFRVGDSITITDTASVTNGATVTGVIDEYSFIIAGQGALSGSVFSVQRGILKPKVDSTLSQYSYIEKYYANVQNTYVKFNQDLLVASASFPNYYNQPLDFYDRKVVLNGEYNGDTFTVSGVNDHGYQTGDTVYYDKYVTQDPEFGFEITSGFDIREGVYYVRRLSSSQFKLASSQANLYNESYVSISGIVTSNTLQYKDFRNKELEHQNLLREIKAPNNESGIYETEPGKTGILINGVEVLNYKSENVVYYGSLDNITVSAKGNGYDVINPPGFNITDDVGTGATAVCAVKGSLQRIEIIDSGFDYVSKPIITITGGNGTGAKASVNTKFVEHTVSFNSTSTSGEVSLTDNTIGFATYHKFRNNERVIYKTDGQTAITGLSADSQYYVETVDASTVKLYNTEGDAISGLNTVSLTSFGVGVHRIQSFDKKQIISNIVVDSSGFDYENKERSVSVTGINTALNQVRIASHGYNSGEIIKYSTSGTAVDGITEDTSYYVTVIDEDNFKLSAVGLGTTTKSFYYDTKQYINLTSTGSGTHTFNYEPISVNVNGKIGVATFSGQDFNAVIQPVFRGEIDSVQVTDGGVGYGASTIIGYNRQPLLTVSSGSGAELLPIVYNGQIIEVLVTNQGNGYNSPPDLVVNGTGNYAKLTPVLNSGRIVEVKIESPGSGYEEKTTSIDIIASGSGAIFNAEIQKWTVNLFEKYFNVISSDDGILANSTNEDFGIQYTNLYAPRKLRESIYGKSQDNQVKYGIFDLQKISENEVASQYHSPIIGWAYDGNPIYGPYGYSTKSGGTIRAMESGYERIEKSNRPSQFDLGFFVEDYEFTGNGDLDEHNGRFCVTPDYPNGTYAYFATINPGAIESSGPFAKYKIPVFPYLIGNTYKSKPNEFNFKSASNQVSYDLNSSEWFRNTTPYFLNEDTAQYNFLYQPNKVRTQSVNITNVSTGSINNIGILTGGTGYQVNDKIEFESSSGQQPAKAKVTRIGGKVVTNISVASSIISNLEIVPYDATGSYVAFANSPHNFNNSDLVSLSGFNTSINSLQRSFTVGVSTERFSLNTGVGTAGVTGIVTYFEVAGQLRNELLAVRENDILQIEDEKVKVLNIDIKNSRIRVLRSVEGTVSAAHTATTLLSEVSRKFTIDSLPENRVTFNYNRELYFNPVEALGIGTLSGVGIGTTISFANPGAGLTQIFIPTRTIYLPSHELNTGDLVSYNNNDGLSIEVLSGVTTFRIANDTPLYVAKVSNDLIGISTFKVGLGSTGTFVGIASTTATSGLLYLTGIGTGTNHSFTTVNSNVVTCEATKNIVTVATASTHGLSLKDNINIDVVPGITTTITVQYDDYNRRIVFNPKSFVSGDVDVSENTITINNHGFNSGDKVIHTSTSPSGGLEDEKIYYVIRYTKDRIKLCNSRYQSLSFNPEVVDISSASSGTISAINPAINAYRGNTVKFDLSDSSLSSLSGSTLYSAFDMNLYTDRELTSVFESSRNSSAFEVTKIGTVGISTNASLSLVVNNTIPEKLYYKFTVVNPSFVSSTKQEIIIDTEVSGSNEINVVKSLYSGSFSVTGLETTATFTYNLPEVPERDSYSSTNSTTSYTTNSTTAYGAISDVQITYKGSGYKDVVGISTIVGVSTNADRNGAILEPSSTSIGRILSSEIDGIGFDYPTDKTLRPVINPPEILQIEPLSSFREIGISSAGNNYSLAPNLVVIDGFTGKQVSDVDLRYELGDTKVTILKNTFGIYNTTPKIIPTNNTNGIRINNISYDSSTKEVTVGLNTSFSDSAPLSVGDKVLIENISVGVGSTGYGYNSSNYGYSLFTLSKVYIPLGGSVGIVTYSLDGYLPEGKYPGNFSALESYGKIIPQKDFPVFDVKFKKNNFILGEEVKSSGNVGKVESWNNEIEILKVSSANEFNVDDLVIGQTSKTQGNIKKKIDFNAEIKLSSSSIVKKGWNRETGFLNFNTERIPDNNYYQNFSYSLKSKISLETWDDAVSSLNHTSGFLKFSDLIVESQDAAFQGVYSDYQGSTVDVIADISRFIDLNCYPYFDIVTENALNGDFGTISDEIYFSTRVLTDYFESFGNRVLTIDDISTQFNDTPRTERFSVVNKFNINQRVKKIFTLASDRRFTGERQALFVTILHNKSQAFIGQYGRVETVLDLGGYDFTISGDEGYLLFYPTKYAVNNYNVTLVNFDIDNTVAGIGSTALGDTAVISSSKVESVSSSTDVVSIASTYRTSKIILEIDADNGVLEYDELNVIHDGTDVELLEYGQLTTNPLDETGNSGLGTYSASISGGNVNIAFNPIAGIACTVNAITVSLASTISAGTGSTIHIGTDDGSDICHIESKTTYISASGSPGINTISTYSSSLSAAYYIVSIEDTTNNRYEMSELISIANGGSNVYLTEYGNVTTAVGLGTIGVGVNDSGDVNLHYTPIAGIDIQVRVFQMSLHLIDADDDRAGELDLNNASITAGYGFYEGTDIDIKRAFELRHKGREIFLRNFDGSDSDVVDVTENTILLPEHFFVTGEELVYSYGSDETSIGITTTSVYAIKINDQKIKLAASAADALNTTPVPIDITGVGVGTFHTLTAKNQNTKCLVAIDNYIQSPIVSTSVTTGLSTNATRSAAVLGFTGITSFFGGDLIQINDEIMKINTVGYGGSATDILVDRGWMGTGIATHAQNSLVTKIVGNYNIVDNTINFITAPKGAIPISSTTNAPDERDWTGITTFSTFQGRVFTRSGIENSSAESYETNYIFDDISQEFDATEKTFTLKSDKNNVTGFSTNNAAILINGIFQGPTGQLSVEQDYSLNESTGITSITFTGTATSIAYDPNNASIPVGGIIVSVGSTGGFGYQPLVSAGGTAVVSIAGTISSVSIGNSGSGYRSGSQTVNVGVTTQNTGTPSIENIGTATISGGHIVSVTITNPGTGYTSSNPPIVIFDAPLSYSNIPLVYSDDSASGFGTEATVNIVVGQGSSVIDFEIQNSGYRYSQSQILTVPIGGATGIPTDTTKVFEEFQITIERTESDKFTGWHFGELLVLDKIENQFNGTKKSFTLKNNSSPITIRAAKGSSIDVQSTLLVFLNDILQVPGEGYLFVGGSTLVFSEAPKGPSADGSFDGDTCKILFYKGSGDVDVVFRDLLETVKKGDTLQIDGEDVRLVEEIISSDTVGTNGYNGAGIDEDPNNQRVVTWCKQTSDKIVNGQIVSKARVLNAALVNPTTNIIQPVGVGSTIAYVESVRTFFNSEKENNTTRNTQNIVLTSQDSIVGASATAVVSVAGTITSIVISDGGVGYTTAPTVTIANPVGYGTTARATATATLTGDSVSSITVSTPGTAYTNTNPPVVLIEIPQTIYENNTSDSYTGDFGIIVGVTSTSVGVASTGFVLDLFIPINSYLRDTTIVSTATTISGIQTGDYFVVKDSNVGSGVTSLYQDNTVLGITTQFLDCVYEVAAVSTATTSVAGVGVTYIRRVTVSVSDLGNISGIGATEFYGEYSWGMVDLGARTSPQTFNSYTSNGSAGISTSATLTRVQPLKLSDYS
jgi:hypothetical protein